MKIRYLISVAGIVLFLGLLAVSCEAPSQPEYGDPGNPDPHPTGSAAATITSIDPEEGYLKDIVTITGSGFNTTAEFNLVSFGQKVGTVLNASATSLEVESPSITGETVDVMVATKGSEFWSNSVEFTFKDAVSLISDTLNWPMGIDADDDGNIYIGSASDEVIYKIDTDGVVTTFAGVAPSGAIRFGAGGWLYVCSSWDGVVKRISADGATVEEVDSVEAAVDIDWDAAGNMYILKNWGGGVDRIDPQGTKTTLIDWDEYGEFKSCRIFGDYFYATEIWGSTIWRFDITASGLENGTAVYEGDSPVGLEIDEEGTLYFTEAWETSLYTLKEDGSTEVLFEEQLMTPMRYLTYHDKMIYIVYPGWGDVGEAMMVYIGIPQAPAPDYTSGR
ncbi:MAG: IPT/TIG domain-containing protein [Fidelibacterota bacterium]|nr:MAG: IPT/TIG domain-containing protein [Candidatus Neomarinimicrobiota bacterium]